MIERSFSAWLRRQWPKMFFGACLIVAIVILANGCRTASVAPDVEPNPSGSPSPIQSPSPTAAAKLRLPLKAGDTYLTYYGSWDSRSISKAQRFPVIIGKQSTPAEVVAQLKARSSAVLLYLSVGEAVETTRDKGDGQGPVKCDGSKRIPLKRGVDSQYVVVKKGDERNSTWGGWYVDGGNPVWQAKVFREADRLFANGADGLFLDTVDTASPWGSGAICTAPGMLDLIERLRARYPTKYIVANRGLFYLDPNASTYSHRYRQAVSGVMFENLTTEWKSERGVVSEWKAGNLAAARYTAAEAAKPDGFSFMVLDYFSEDQLGSQIVRDQMAEVGRLPGVVINSFNNAHLTAIYETLLPRGGF